MIPEGKPFRQLRIKKFSNEPQVPDPGVPGKCILFSQYEFLKYPNSVSMERTAAPSIHVAFTWASSPTHNRRRQPDALWKTSDPGRGRASPSQSLPRFGSRSIPPHFPPSIAPQYWIGSARPAGKTRTVLSPNPEICALTDEPPCTSRVTASFAAVRPSNSISSAAETGNRNRNWNAPPRSCA